LGVEPDDIVQDAFGVILLGSIGWDDDLENVVQSMLTVISNGCKNMQRKVARRADHAWRAKAASPTSADPTESVGVEIDVHECIARLPSRSRPVILACILNDKHPEQYASETGLSATTVRNRIGLAKTALRRSLRSYRE
jgi:DNA-directed RNA polymerase specialized sigma24 family protein